MVLIVGCAWNALRKAPDRALSELSNDVVAECLRALLSTDDRLASQGNTNAMRFCEIRIDAAKRAERHIVQLREHMATTHTCPDMRT